MEEQRNRKPAEPINRGWRIGRQQFIGLWWLMIPLVAILAAILFPILKPPPDCAWARCGANIKELGLAALAHADDNNGSLPLASSWYDALLPYLGEAWDYSLCPVTKKLYVFNDALSGQIVKGIPKPAKVPLFWEAPDDYGRGPHQRRFSVVYLDGHAEFPKEIPHSTRRER